MLLKIAKRSKKNHFHKKCACFLLAKNTKAAVFRWF